MAPPLIRFDLRLPEFATVSRADQYAACLDQCQWAEEHGFSTVILSEHHGTDDGYLPSPLVLAAAIAARTKAIGITLSALLVPYHDPLRLAEDIAVIDNLSRGRLVVIAGLGYRPGEPEMFGIDRRQRGPIMEQSIEVMRRAWTGEPFEHNGRMVRVTPRPFTPPHPMLMVGGSTVIAARRAARLRAPFMAAYGEDPEIERVYYEECAKVGYKEGFAILPHGPGFVHVTEDPEKAWAEIGPCALFDAQTYASWQTPGQRSSVDVHAQTVEDIKASGVYRVVTPDECVALAEELGPANGLLFHPLMGGMRPELGWESLELFAAKVAPRLPS